MIKLRLRPHLKWFMLKKMKVFLSRFEVTRVNEFNELKR